MNNCVEYASEKKKKKLFNSPANNYFRENGILRKLWLGVLGR